MSDVRDWGAFIRGRWDWTRHGYERAFPRGCQFTDVDAAVEFDGRRLLIEAKRHDGAPGELALPALGQLRWLRDEAAQDKAVLVLFGCGVCNSPQALYDVNRGEWFDWRGLALDDRRSRLKNHIDRALGLHEGEEQAA